MSEEPTKLSYNPQTYLPVVPHPAREIIERRKELEADIDRRVKDGLLAVPGDVTVNGGYDKWRRVLAGKLVDKEFSPITRAYDRAMVEGEAAFRRDLEGILSPLPPVIAGFVDQKSYEDGHYSGFREVIHLADGMAGELEARLRSLMELLKEDRPMLAKSEIRKALGYKDTP